MDPGAFRTQQVEGMAWAGCDAGSSCSAASGQGGLSARFTAGLLRPSVL